MRRSNRRREHKWSKNFDERPHRRGGFFGGKFNVTLDRVRQWLIKGSAVACYALGIKLG